MPARLGREEERVELGRWIALLGLVCAPVALPGQAPEWQASVARVSVTLKDSSRLPGTAIVVAVREQTVYLVTCAHVVEGDLNPKVEFMAVADRTFTATRKDFQDEGKRGLALLVVNDVPREVRVVTLAAQAKPVMGERVIVAGFPAAVSSNFTVVDAIVSNARGTDLTLSRETGPGFSGGPVLRGDTAIGLVYGEEGRFGLALLTNVVVTYLEGLGVVVADARPPAEPAATRGAPATPLAAQPPPGPKAGDTRTNSKSGLKDVWIPPGTFQMGCSAGDTGCQEEENPAHPVAITKGFWIGQTPVTVGAYWRYSRATGKPMPPEPKFGERALNPGWSSAGQPIVNVTWDEAAGYCAWTGMRLPTEAEWEYAARAGSREARYGSLDDIAWYADNSGNQRLDSERIAKEGAQNYYKRLAENGNGPKVVGQKLPNAWQLYDMLGNVLEWTADWYGEKYYQTRDGRDPQGPPDGERRVLRGVSWSYPWRGGIRVSGRGRFPPEVRDAGQGFRCAGE